MFLDTEKLEAGKRVFHQSLEQDVKRIKIAQPIESAKVHTRGMTYFFLLICNQISDTLS